MDSHQTLAGDVTAMVQQAFRPFVSLAAAQAEMMTCMMEAQMRLWQAAQSATFAAAMSGFSADGSETGADAELSPSLALAMRDVQECGEAVVRAQLDALNAVRRSS